MNPYSSKEWKAFRSHVLLLDNHQCATCGRGADDGATLHVHHKEYVAGRLPWQYAFDKCEALCAGCHAAEHGLIPPKVGWEFAGQDDLGDLCGNCELCGTEIRHVFLVHHPNWVSLEVGEVCCDHLTDTHIASNFMESMRRYNARRKRFVGSSRWQFNRRGHEYIKQQQILIELRDLDAGFQIRMNGTKGKVLYQNAIEAKARAFDVLESQEHTELINRIRRQAGPPEHFLRMK